MSSYDAITEQVVRDALNIWKERAERAEQQRDRLAAIARAFYGYFAEGVHPTQDQIDAARRALEEIE